MKFIICLYSDISVSKWKRVNTMFGLFWFICSYAQRRTLPFHFYFHHFSSRLLSCSVRSFICVLVFGLLSLFVFCVCVNLVLFLCVAFPMYFRLYLWYAFKLLNFLLLLKLMFVSFSFWVHVTWSHKGWDRSFCFLCIYFGICMRCAVVVSFFVFAKCYTEIFISFRRQWNSRKLEPRWKFTEICRRRRKKHPGERKTEYHQRLYNDMPAEWKGARGTVPPYHDK